MVFRVIILKSTRRVSQNMRLVRLILRFLRIPAVLGSVASSVLFHLLPENSALLVLVVTILKADLPAVTGLLITLALMGRRMPFFRGLCLAAAMVVANLVANELALENEIAVLPAWAEFPLAGFAYSAIALRHLPATAFRIPQTPRPGLALLRRRAAAHRQLFRHHTSFH